jgi:hypothetical protein
MRSDKGLPSLGRWPGAGSPARYPATVQTAPGGQEGKSARKNAAPSKRLTWNDRR